MIEFFSGNRIAAVCKSLVACSQISACDDFAKGKFEGDCDAVSLNGASLNSLPNWKR